MPRKPTPVPAVVTRPVNHNSVVASSNSLLPHLAPLTQSELRLIAFCAAHYDSTVEDGDDRAFTAKVSDLVEIFPSMDIDSAYSVVREVFESLGKKPLKYKEGRIKKIRHWFIGVDYEEDGKFTFYIPPDTQPFFLALKGNFSSFRLRDVYQFRSAATWKLYESLIRWRVAARWTVDLAELKQLLGVTGKYPRWGNFKSWVIDHALAEINEHSDIHVTYQPTKRGRSITGLVFFIAIKKRGDDNLAADEEAAEDKLTKALLACGITAKAAANLVDMARKENQVARLIKAVPKMAARATVRGQVVARYVTGSVKKEIQQQPLMTDAAIAEACSRKIRATGGSCTPKGTRACDICQSKNAR